MERIEWDEKLAFGVPAIDDDHRELVDCYNRLFRAIFTDHDGAAARTLFEALVERTEDHFHREEILMERFGYPDLAAHKAEHQCLLVSARLLQERILASGSLPVTCHRFAFLRSWLLNHIIGTDRALARFILQAREPAGVGTAMEYRPSRQGLEGL